MLTNLINKYEDNDPIIDLMGQDSGFRNYLRELSSDTTKIAYLELRVTNPTISQKDIAEQIGVTPKTICEWQRDSQFKRVIIELLQEEYRLQRTELISILYSKAKEGEYKAIDMFLKHTS